MLDAQPSHLTLNISSSMKSIRLIFKIVDKSDNNSSHTKSHWSNRPYYCPVLGCARSEGGKGFKRKDEMIRHGLVHDSPGYFCPFCPEIEHEYPRPDFLQRYTVSLGMGNSSAYSSYL